jgi:fluoroquinolone transport system ATP-binding protein
MITVEGLTFAYGKDPPAVRALSFAVAPGEIFGFLGPSGAGKSTTQKILMRLLKGYAGRVEVMGRPLADWGADYFERIGVCFEFPSHYRMLTGLENLAFFAQFFSVPTAKPQELLERVGLGDDGRKRVEEYSKGMQIRLNLARALLNAPKLLFLDEPTAGLDPGNARRIRQLILQKKAEGVTVFLTTHDMTVADELCDRVGFLVDGRLTSVDAPEALRLKHGRRAVRVQYLQHGARAAEEFALDGLAGDARFQALIADRPIETIHSLEPSLEEVFIAVTGRELA